MTTDVTGGYRDKFTNDADAQRYDAVEYAEQSVSQLIWEFEARFLVDIVQRMRWTGRRIDYLDFACGTGRIISLLEGKVDSATGIDVSPAMLRRARTRAIRSRLICRDISQESTQIEGPYDLITAFRFVTNAEHSLRIRVLRALAVRLKGPESLLVLNSHGNPWSYKAVTLPYRWLQAQRNGVRLTGYVTNRELVDDLRRAGLTVHRVVGMGFVPGRVLRFVSWGAARRIEQLFAVIPIIQRWGVNQIFICGRHASEFATVTVSNEESKRPLR